MLVYVDTERSVRIFSSDDPERKPVQVGAVLKTTFEVRLESNALLSEAELEEIQDVAERLRIAAGTQKRLDALRFPEITRQVLSYYTTIADELEKRLISSALRQAVRTIRRHDNAVGSKQRSDAPLADLDAVGKTMRWRLRTANEARSVGLYEQADALVNSVINETPSDFRGERWYDVAVAASPNFGRLITDVGKRRIYIAGCGRSGTWFALGMMATFEGVYITPEERHFGHFGVLAERPEPVHIVKRMHDAHRYLDTIPAQIDILYMLRDPRDVLTSRHGQTENYISLERWKEEMAALTRLLSINRGTTKVVRFEDLATAPTETQRKLADYFGLTVSHPATQFHRVYKPSAGALAAMHDIRPPDSNAVGRWRRNPDQVAFVRQVLPQILPIFAPIAQRFGYDLRE